MPFIDFAALKTGITIEQVVAKLGITMRQEGTQMRGNCPACHTIDNRQLVVTPSKGVYYCFADKRGGDLIAFTAHVRGESVKEAAAFLSGIVGNSSTSNSSSRTSSPQEPGRNEDPLAKVAARLEFDHPQVQALGLSPDRARALGIGFDAKGMMRGRVLWPLYDQGQLVGFMGLDDKGGVKLPPNLTNVVPLRKTGT